ncbi:MAG: hypothetical protein GY913_11020 [Proteobacteria bacterium]|nr:hypothetical protein [Pseudomonadota bacterium]MCP4917445.1 hypothetical protein [Pseudomonadota bacterium]
MILAGTVIAVAWLGHRFITSSTQATEGTGDVSELAVLPESANEKARNAAAACDEGDGNACTRWESGDDQCPMGST